MTAASPDYDIVIIGSGPGGLSAAARAKALGQRHILLEAQPHISHTIEQYQKGKHVMAEPAVLPLRSDMSFRAGRREATLGTWSDELRKQGVNVAYRKRVSGIAKADKVFTVMCDDGGVYTSGAVILAIGVQGNIRKLGVPGEDHECVGYTLSDPDEFKDQTVVVVGAGDAGIENALALSRQNKVYILNRQDEFANCKEGNRVLVEEAQKEGRLTACYSATTLRIDPGSGPMPINLVYDGTAGETVIPCHRVIARLGATPPRKLLESFGIAFHNSSPGSMPVLSETYESSVKGLYIVGALAGYPLIKQAMNQGYEVVQTIIGKPVEPVDEPLLREKLKVWRGALPVWAVIDLIHASVPLFKGMVKLQLRELMLDSTMMTPEKGAIIFKKFDYTNTFYAVLEGSVDIEIEVEGAPPRIVKLERGQYFGEMGLISGRRRSATVRAGDDCVLLETPRRTMLKLIAAVDDIREQTDQVFMRNAIVNYIGSMLNRNAVNALVDGGVEVRRYNANQVLFREGDKADGMYLIRRGSVTVSQKIGGKDRILSYVAAGHYVGEMALLRDAPRSATVTATVLTEALVLDAETVRQHA